MSKKAWLIIGFCLSGIAFIAIANGCDLKDFVTVDVPPTVRTAVGVPQDERVTFNQAQVVYDDWITFVERETLWLAREMEVSERRYRTLIDVINTGWGAAEPHLSAIPGGSVIIAMLTGMMGVLIPQPGTKKKIREVQAKSFKQGMAVERAHRKSDK